MTAIQYLGAFRYYGADVLLIAAAVTLLTALLKKTALKSCPKKLFVFLPFLIGTLLYASFRAIVTMSAAPFTEEFASTLEGGFSCGCAATLYYVVYEQFFRTKTDDGATALSPLLEGYVPEEKRAEAELALLGGSENREGEELLSFVKETLQTYCEPALPDAELVALAALVTRFLTALPR